MLHPEADVDAAFRHFERDPAACVVIDLSALAHAGKVRTVERCLVAAGEMRYPELAGQLRKAERRWSRGEITDLRRAIDEQIAARYRSEEL